jgi:hypothetical protein
MDFLLDVGPTGLTLGVPEWETTPANRKSNTEVLIVLLLSHRSTLRAIAKKNPCLKTWIFCLMWALLDSNQ